ncbi:MAG: DNA-directed RNA polymerase subunit omega [Deltaproteobacteria bacterium]|nr:DNA-directed RNA polymerase subunit omega [Candidatus Tharpella sp.]
MARITVEDCLLKVENRFELITLSSKRAKEIIKQKRSLLDGYKNRPIVMSLREISAGRVWSDRD